MKRLLLLAALLLTFALLLLAARIARWFWVQAQREPAGTAEYVALGSSFASGPGVEPQDPRSAWLCYRSLNDYPHLLAARRGLQLLDRSCSGATTAHILDRRQYPFMTRQIDAVTAQTRLVTVTIGGNDVDYIRNLVAWSWRNAPGGVPWFWKFGTRRPTPDAAVDAKLEALAINLRRLADTIRQRAPAATLVFVDYATVLPDGAGCPERLPLSNAQLARGRHVARRMSEITAKAAADSGALLVQASVLSREHDVCANEPWVFGWTLPGDPLRTYGPVAYHPTIAAMRAIATAIDAQLSGPRKDGGADPAADAPPKTTKPGL
ncbi:SGNH/GDSL hydrolase family protein [Solimonas marina]|uniref:SGNH/GDSL hydrolase family protein n=1 Tax=Solimonas marina TaxID=2714601 RepID=A0A970B5L5_9GAMM|nr:SGNH/GDSL hydrolase family protein [Solimonas marina]NKF23527.1 SGNH/GDSL hydrolase family protein [Solimonas marina]